ncbi:hypothetical protein ACLOJK_029241 [Asimina triloba]
MYTVVGTLPEHRFRCSIFPKSANPAAIEDPSPTALQSDPSGSDPTMVPVAVHHFFGQAPSSHDSSWPADQHRRPAAGGPHRPQRHPRSEHTLRSSSAGRKPIRLQSHGRPSVPSTKQRLDRPWPANLAGTSITSRTPNHHQRSSTEGVPQSQIWWAVSGQRSPAPAEHAQIRSGQIPIFKGSNRRSSPKLPISSSLPTLSKPKFSRAEAEIVGSKETQFDGPQYRLSKSTRTRHISVGNPLAHRFSEAKF